MTKPPSPLSLLANVPVIPVLTVEIARDAVPLARALAAGGLGVIEVTLRTKAALDAIGMISAALPDVVVGAGTVMTADDVNAAVKAGARYLVSPGTPSALAEAFMRAKVPVIPGCATVSEAMALAACGFEVLKFFPAVASGGVGWLKSVAGPLPDLRFCPTGGVDITNAAVFLALPNVVAVGGTWVAPHDVVSSGDFARVTVLAREAATLRR